MSRAPLDRSTAWLALLALAACAGALVTGFGAALWYTDWSTSLGAAGLAFERLRAIHETLAGAWMFLGGAAIVAHWLRTEFGPASPAASRRVAGATILWAASGVGILAALAAGRFSGREYLAYSPAFSAVILIGWGLFAWNYYERVGLRMTGRPAWVCMWTAAFPLFVISYLEQNLYLLDALSDRPVRDLAVQWRANGVMVGSFNQLLYGCLMLVAARVRGDEQYAHSRTAFALFCVGLLNTFTNYGHHTFHLPQSPWIHWISFIVSMLEVVILVKVFVDLVRLRRVPVSGGWRVTEAFLRSATLWIFLMLALALVISVPPLNGVIHGTHVVVAHSMGSMIGIDSMIVWAGLSYLLRRRSGGVPGIGVTAALRIANTALFVFWVAFLGRGAAAGWTRQVGPSAPDFSPLVKLFPVVMAAAGGLLAASVLWFVVPWMAALARQAVGAPPEGDPGGLAGKESRPPAGSEEPASAGLPS